MKNLTLSFIALFGLLLFWQCTQAQKLPRRPFFGARLLNITAAQKATLKLPDTKGVCLDKISPNSSAALASFQSGDVLVSINNKPIENVQQFIPSLKQFKAGEKVHFTYYRNGKKYRTNMTFQEFPKMKSNAYDIVYGSVKASNNHLRTIITKPKGGGRFPAVVIVQGLGCVTIDSPAYRFSKNIADSLTRHGIVVMQIEKTGMGDSKGSPCRECTFEEEVEGYRQGLKALKKLPYVQADQTFMFGFSMGGVIAPIIASETSVKGIIAYGTVGRNWLEYEIENTRRQAEMANLPYDEIGNRMQTKEKALHYLMVEKMNTQDIIAKHPETAPYLRYPQHNKYLQSVGGLNMAAYWLKTDAHVFAIHGEADFVSFAKDHELIAKMVNSRKAGKGTHLELPNSDHWLNKVKTMQESLRSLRNRNTPKNHQLFSIVSQWILDKSKT